MKSRLHISHLGYDSMMRREKNTIFWPGIVKDVKQLADNCEICRESKAQNCRDTLKQHDTGAFPWNMIELNIFEIKGRNYLIPYIVIRILSADNY